MNPILRSPLLIATVVGAALSTAFPAGAYELSPLPTKAEVFKAKRSYGVAFRSTFPAIEWGIHTFSNAVHESLTQQAHECDDTIEACSDIDLDFASTGVIAGVRWNDDPPFRFASGQGRYPECPADKGGPRTISFALGTTCWVTHFRDVSKTAERDGQAFLSGKGTLLARSHYGDLQFLHSMAKSSAATSEATKSAILAWAEFTWRVQSRLPENISGKVAMGKVPVPGLREFFPAVEERTVEELFTIGRPWLRHQLEDIAFGSLLHMVQDSFSAGHTLRRPAGSGSCSVPPVVTFHTYAGQDKGDHKKADTKQAATAANSPIVLVLKELVRLRSERAAWTEVRLYLANCVYALATPSAVTAEAAK